MSEELGLIAKSCVRQRTENREQRTETMSSPEPTDGRAHWWDESQFNISSFFFSHWLTGTLTIKLLFKGAGRALVCEILTLLGIIWVLNNLLVRDSNFCEQPANPGDYRLTAQHWVQSVHHKWSLVAVNSNYMLCCWYDLLWRGTSMELWGGFRCSYVTRLLSHISSYH